MSQEKFLEHFESLVFGERLDDKLLHDIVHYLHKAGHLLLGELLPLGEVTIQIGELLQDSSVLGPDIVSTNAVDDLSLCEPLCANLLTFLARLCKGHLSRDSGAHLPV